MNLDGCANLECLEFGDQNECFDISALNCPNLNIIDLRTYHSGNVAVQPKSFSAPVMLNTLGNGGAGLYGRDGSYALIAQGVRYDENGNLIENDGFLGWYADGQLLSTERELQLSDGIRAAACFAGDVNEDGAINMADALLIMRCATELGGELPLRLADADRNGSIGIPDALLAAMGLYYVPELLLLYLNRQDNRKMMPDLQLIYQALEVQTCAGVYVTDALTECCQSVRTQRLQQALMELSGDLVIQSDLVTALSDFQQKFDNRQIDALCITLIQAGESGQAVDLLKDMGEQLKDMELTVLQQQKSALDRSITFYQLGMLGAVLGIILYACVGYMFRAVVQF